VKPPTQLSQQDILQVAWLSTDPSGSSRTLLLTIATQSWHPLGIRFAEEQQAFAEIGVVDFSESTPTIDIIKRWNGNLHWLPGLLAWYRKEDYARIDRYVEGNPLSGGFGQMTCSIDTHDPVLAIKVGAGSDSLPSIAAILTAAPIRSTSIRHPGEPQLRYTPSQTCESVPANIDEINFPYLFEKGYTLPSVSQCAGWWTPARNLQRTSA
jgi:hypothetical protein